MQPFEHHNAHYWMTPQLGTKVERLVFSNPKSSNYYIEFIATGRSLIVTGDCYEAIYGVGQTQDLAFWASTDLGYFAGKIRGLNGQSPERWAWDRDEAKKDLARLFEELKQEVLDEQDDDEPVWDDIVNRIKDGMDDQFEGAELRLKMWLEWCPEDYISSEHEFTTFVHEHGDDVFGQDHYEILGNFGKVTNPQIALHHEGLKLAWKQVSETFAKPT